MKMSRMSMLLFVVLLAACQPTPDSSQRIPKQTQAKEKGLKAMNQQFILAAEKGDTAKVQRLLEDGADINVTDDHGRTAVMTATYNNKADTVKVLIENGADIDIRDDHLNNVLLYSGAEGMLEIVKLAIDAGADTSLTNRFGGTALIPAAERGHVEVVKELLTNSDIDVNHINNLHWTALLEAVILGDGGVRHQQIVQLLVDHGADVNIADKDGITPLEHAQQLGYKEIEKILEQRGLKSNE